MESKELISGKIHDFSNEEDQIKKGGDDIREASVFFSQHLQKFCISFNGELIHTCKEFRSLEKPLIKLKNKWNLKEI